MNPCDDWASIRDLADLGVHPPSTEETAPFWEGLADHRVMLERCLDCDLHSFPPRGLCRRCGSRVMGWVEAEGPGVVYSYTVNHHPWAPGRSHYILVLAELPKCSGVRLVGLLDSRQEPGIGDRVDFAFAKALGDVTRLHFVPRDES